MNRNQTLFGDWMTWQNLIVDFWTSRSLRSTKWDWLLKSSLEFNKLKGDPFFEFNVEISPSEDEIRREETKEWETKRRGKSLEREKNLLHF